MQKLTQALRRDSAQPSTSGLIAPELARRKEALEAFPLDSMAMVGSLNRNGQPVALISVDKLLYQVRVGNYLGLNYGRITRISETELGLREIVQDAAGEWIERVATLQLQERSRNEPTKIYARAVAARGRCRGRGSGAAAVVHAQNAIESVTSSMQSGAEVIRIDFSQPLAAAPTGFAIQSPARVALDFPGVTNAIGRNAIEVNQGNLRSVNVVQAGERTRLVLNLKQATAYKTEIQGKSLLVSLEPVAGCRTGGFDAQSRLRREPQPRHAAAARCRFPAGHATTPAA